jgi:cell division protein FtsB
LPSIIRNEDQSRRIPNRVLIDMAKRRTRTSFAREIYYILCLALFIVSAFFAFWGPGGWRELKKAQLEMEVRRARVDALDRQNNERLKSIEALKSRKDEIERIARQEGYAQEGEIIQRVPSDTPSREPEQPPSKP